MLLPTASARAVAPLHSSPTKRSTMNSSVVPHHAAASAASRRRLPPPPPSGAGAEANAARRRRLRLVVVSHGGANNKKGGFVTCLLIMLTILAATAAASVSTLAAWTAADPFPSPLPRRSSCCSSRRTYEIDVAASSLRLYPAAPTSKKGLLSAFVGPSTPRRDGGEGASPSMDTHLRSGAPPSARCYSSSIPRCTEAGRSNALQGRIGFARSTIAAGSRSRSTVRRSSISCGMRLWAANAANSVGGGETEDYIEDPSTRRLLMDVKKALKRSSWLSWWCQVILTTISSIILLFARNVLLQQQQPSLSLAAPKLFLSTSGLITSALSIIWTWGNGQRLSRRIVKPQTSTIRAAMLLRRAIKVGCILNLIGLLLHLLAAEQIVGALAIKVLTLPRSSLSPYGFGAAGATSAALDGALQPLDILIVQANTNSLLSHFCSLVLLLCLIDPLHKLDPPSTVDEPPRGGGRSTP